MSQDHAAQILQAFQRHQAGDFQEAERVYRELLAVDPNHLDACQLLGALLVQNNRPADAMPFLQKAIAQRPDVPQYHVNLGTAQSRLKNLEAAAQCYQRALRLDPRNLDGLRNLGSVLSKLRRYDEAIPYLQQALALNPRLDEVRVSLGVALLKAGRNDEAAPLFESVLAHSPHHRQALAGLGQSLLKKTEADERALTCWRELVSMEPDNPAMHNNLATVLKKAKQFAEAEAACRRALELRPSYFPALCNLGMVLGAANRFEEARDCLEQAVAADPDGRAGETNGRPQADQAESLLDEVLWSEFACVAYCQLAAIHNVLGDLPKARHASDRALAIDPNDSDSHMMRGFLDLECGELQRGWPEYEWRRRGKQPPRKFPRPEWTGEPLPNGTVLLHAEQGLGDTIHFVRYGRLVRQRVGRVAFLCHRPLAALIRSCRDLDEVISDGDPLPAYDAHVPLLSLPHLFQTSLETIPAEVPYLDADPKLVEHWRRRLADIAGFRVGICWQGNRQFAHDHLRSMPLRLFRGLAEIPGVRLISLQKGDGVEQVQEIDFEVLTFPDMDTESGAFMDTAAIMRNLDLVISSDTATPHLAGALGVPMWLATSFAAEWRWLRDREDNPWYPTMRLFRQSTLDDWTAVFERMRESLAGMVEGGGQESEIRNPKSETNPKSEGSKLAVLPRAAVQ